MIADARHTAKIEEFEEKGIAVEKAGDIIIHFFETNSGYVYTFKGLTLKITNTPPSTLWYALAKLIKQGAVRKKLLNGKIFYGLTNNKPTEKKS